MEGKVGYEKPRRVFTQGSNWQPRQVLSLALEEFRDPTGAAPNYTTALFTERLALWCSWGLVKGEPQTEYI
jgi:hypothetical protein